MRVFFLAAACIGGLIGTMFAHAAGIDGEFFQDWPSLGKTYSGPDALQRDGTLGRPLGLPSMRPNTRFAQVGKATTPPEYFSGNPTVAPFKWVGMLKIPNPTQKYPNETLDCTAQFIKPNVLLTAAHCVKDLPSNPTGPWPDPTKGTFILQFQNGAGTQFKVACAAVGPQWSLPANFASLNKAQQQAALTTAFAHDFAMILINGTSPTGAMPYILDWKGKADYAFRVGYPANILDAEIVQATPGVVFFSDAIPLGTDSSPNLVVQWGPVTDATQGMSGGAWVTNIDPNEGANSNVLIAVTSFGPVNSFNAPVFPGGTFAAYLTSAEFNPLLGYVSNGCK
jgi:hypothetical protein